MIKIKIRRTDGKKIWRSDGKKRKQTRWSKKDIFKKYPGEACGCKKYKKIMKQ